MVKNFQFVLKKLSECPLCHELGLITNSTKDEGVDLFCSNCNLEFTSFPFRNFIKLRGFRNYNFP